MIFKLFKSLSTFTTLQTATFYCVKVTQLMIQLRVGVSIEK